MEGEMSRKAYPDAKKTWKKEKLSPPKGKWNVIFHIHFESRFEWELIDIR